MKRGSADDRDRAWRLLVALVMDGRNDWRRKVIDASGLPFSRVRALRRLKGAPLTMGALGEAITTDAPATTVIVNDLEKRGLVRRDPEPTDRRAKIVSLTTEGKRALRAVEGVTERAPPSFDALTAEDVAHLLRIAERLKDG